MKIKLRDVQDCNVRVALSDYSTETGPAQYSAHRAWQLAALSAKNLLVRIPHAAAFLVSTSFSDNHLAAAYSYGDVEWTVLGGSDTLTGDDTIWRISPVKALILPRCRENLETACFLAWTEGVFIVADLDRQHDKWSLSKTRYQTVKDYCELNTLCVVRASYDGVEIEVSKESCADTISKALHATILEWNGESVDT